MASNRRRTASVLPDVPRLDGRRFDVRRIGALVALSLGTVLGGCSAIFTWDRTDNEPLDGATPVDSAPPVDSAAPVDAPPPDRATPVDVPSISCVMREQCGPGGHCCRNRCAQCCDDGDCPSRMNCEGGRCR